MPVSPEDIENTLRSAIPVSYVEVKDQSSGCGESYAVFVVSEVKIDYKILRRIGLV